jgi:hypothetical protein
MAWQPIETAPTDGTAILAAGPSADGGYFASVVEWIDPYLSIGECEMGFYEVGLMEHGIYSELDCLTHWMPLPEPPQVQP